MTLSILQAASEEPARPAWVVEGQEVSFAEVASKVRSAIGWLQEQKIGVQGSAPVALLGLGTPRALTLFYALLEMGTPVAMVHPGFSEKERWRWWSEVRAAAFLDPSRRIPGLESGQAAADPPPVADNERPLAIVRTSGSSGRPKGVVLSRRAFLAAAEASADNLGWRQDDRWFLSLPVAHVGGLSIVTRCLVARRPVVIRSLARFDAACVARILREDRVTLLSLVATMLERLLALEGFVMPSSVRAILLGGAAAPVALLERAAELGWPVLATYGLTEACTQVATQRLGSARHSGRGCEPVAGMEVRIRRGVVEIRGETLMTGYLPQPTTSPFDEDGWFATGDLGRLDDTGRLRILGRRDDVIVTGGENVHPLEVEEALQEHPAVLAACAFSVPDRQWGEAVAVAVVEATPLAEAELEVYLAERLAPHQRPKLIARLGELPRTAVGKVDRRQTAQVAQAYLRPISDG